MQYLCKVQKHLLATQLAGAYSRLHALSLPAGDEGIALAWQSVPEIVADTAHVFIQCGVEAAQAFGELLWLAGTQDGAGNARL
jgi:hypothetical protein